MAAVARNVHISGQQFIETATGENIVLGGPNVVVKGPPYAPRSARFWLPKNTHKWRQIGRCRSDER